jgi:hypothetical protein
MAVITVLECFPSRRRDWVVRGGVRSMRGRPGQARRDGIDDRRQNTSWERLVRSITSVSADSQRGRVFGCATRLLMFLWPSDSLRSNLYVFDASICGQEDVGWRTFSLPVKSFHFRLRVLAVLANAFGACVLRLARFLSFLLAMSDAREGGEWRGERISALFG